MVRFLAIRLSLIVVTLLVVSVVIFAVSEALPSDAAERLMGQYGTEQNVKHLREELGLDRSAPDRYGRWIWGAVQGDLGTSLVQRQPITAIVGHRLLPSIYLAVSALLIAVPLAVLVGIWAGVRPNSKGDRAVSLIGMIGISLPEFVTGLFLTIIVALRLGWLPTTSAIPRGETPLTKPEILILPTLTLTIALFAYIMRMTRASVIETMDSHYVRSAILKGLSRKRVIFRHAVPNAMLPTITVVATTVGWLLGGLIIVENVFAYPGLGQLLLNSIQTRDGPLLQACALIIAVAYTFSNLFADISYRVLDPRVRLT